MDRGLFLDRIRRRLDGTAPPAVRIPRRWATEIGDASARFTRELEAVGGTVHRLRGESTATVLAPVLGGHHGASVLIGGDGLPGDLEEAVAAAGGRPLRVGDASRAEVASAAVGVTGASLAVAETGTIVIPSSAASGRTPSLLPPVHVAFVATDSIVPTTAELFRRLAALSERPSSVVLITGPSKSADIGLELTLGVHGPGELHVVLYDGVA